MENNLLWDVAIRLYGIDDDSPFSYRRVFTMITMCPATLSSFPSVASGLQIAFILSGLAYCFKRLNVSDFYIPIKLFIFLSTYVVLTMASNLIVIKYASL